MKHPSNLILSAVALFLLGLAPVAFPPANAAADRQRLAMMDDDKMPMKPAPSASGSSTNMGQPASQPQSMSGGRMNDDKMKMPGATQDCQGAGCQPGAGMMQMMQMMEMMEKMMRGQMSSSRGGGAMSGPADVTERLEGRIAFLKTELQIGDS
jgi:hypothetical protein